MQDLKSRLNTLLSEPSSDAGDDAPRRARVERSRAEMMAQGEAIAATLSRESDSVDTLAGSLLGRGVDRIVVLGCGDSWYCAAAARYGFERLTGLPVEAAQALDWALYGSGGATSRTLVIGLSSGGNTPAVMAALRAAKEKGALAIGVSNTVGAPVNEAFDGGLMIHATRRGWPTQSSTAAIAALLALACALARRMGPERAAAAQALSAELGRLPALVDAATAQFDEPARRIAQEFAAARIILFAGAGPHWGAAGFGAAKVKELGPIHALALPLEEYHHYRSQKTGDPLFLIAPDEASASRAFDTALVSEALDGRTVALVPAGDRRLAGRVEALWELPAVSADLAPILYSVPLHLFAYHFASARFAAGLGYPGAFPETSG
jgi:glucosamine--fructose-6-phosphate aminotransferase (isomerizing)